MVNPVRSRWSLLSSEQKISAVLVGLCGFFAIGFAFIQMNAQIRSPFLVQKSVVEKSQKFFAEQEAENVRIETLRQKDTDRDGINDYDELNVYRTSPYLADTDSDNVSDAEEIARGTDPSCPEGTQCVDTQNQIVQSTTSSISTEVMKTNQIPLVGLGSAGSASGTGDLAGMSGVQSFLDNPPLPSSLTPAEIRVYLASHNLVPKEQLDGLPDSIVIQAYTAAYQEAMRVQDATRAVTQSVGDSSLTTIPSLPSLATTTNP